MNTEVIEENVLIANRVPPNDRWTLVIDDNTVYNSLTDALQAWFEQTGFKGSYRLDPLDSKLYAIHTKTVEVERVKPKEYSFYGDVFTQGV